MSRNHIHYGGWTIEWIEHESHGYNFAIGTCSYRGNWNGLEPLRIQFGNFETIQNGINQCKQSLEKIHQAQLSVALEIAKQYLDSINPPVPIEPAPLETQGEGE
jgi:hypothetical protein